MNQKKNEETINKIRAVVAAVNSGPYIPLITHLSGELLIRCAGFLSSGYNKQLLVAIRALQNYLRFLSTLDEETHKDFAFAADKLVELDQAVCQL